MAEIAVEQAQGDDFEVRVAEGGAESTHTVTLTDQVYEELGQGFASREELLRACFEFLLAREPKESILSRFEVPVIGRYFPEFEDEIRR